MKVSDIVCPACDSRIADVIASLELFRSDTTSQVQTFHAKCTRGHALRVGWTPDSLLVEVRKEGV